ncbi:MAG: glycosyltransferase [Sulfolobales archaeon]
MRSSRMIAETIELYETIIGKGFYYLPIHFLIFVVLHISIALATSRRPIEYRSLRRGDVRVSVVIAEYGEKPEIFERVMRSVAMNRPDEVIVVHDDGSEEIAGIARRYGARVITLGRRVGKKGALAIGWIEASGDIVVHVDSDTILTEGAIEEIVKPFDDPRVVGVQGRNMAFRTGSWLAWRLSILIEAGRDLVCRSLGRGLIVVDGRYNAWRRRYLLEVLGEFLEDRFLGVPTSIGDDRLLTWLAHRRGYLTAYQPSSVAITASPPTMRAFIGQQLRWGRSGYLFFIREIYTGTFLRMRALYILHLFLYYLSPISFTIAIVHDTILAPPIYNMLGINNIALSIALAVVGSSLVSYIRRAVLGLWRVSLKELLAVGAVGLFITYPLMIYAMITVRRQNSWVTR